MSAPEAAARYLDALDSELSSAGIPRKLRSRIHAEFADHLQSDPAADLGAPKQIARQFADELGTSFARAAALKAFAALAVAGVLVVARVAMLGSPTRLAAVGPPAQGNSAFDMIGLLVGVVAAQIAFVSGTLGALRALRLRRRDTIPQAEAIVIGRRAGVALAAGAVTTLAALLAVPFRTTATPFHGTGGAWEAWAVTGLALVAIALAVRAVLRAARLRPAGQGAAGDVLSDFGPLQPTVARAVGGSTDRFAVLSAIGIAAFIAAVGIAGDDPYDGILRGLLEGGAYLGTYALLGTYLGLRRG
jgi:hypothetical protein